MRTAETTRRIMSAVKARDTRPELALRRALWAAGVRGYRVDYKRLPGRPDVAFTRWRVAVFVDGDYWHGHNWVVRGLPSFEAELSKYSDYWRKKILRNVERDLEVDAELRGLGWTVVRVFESEIKSSLPGCVQAVQDALFAARVDAGEYLPSEGNSPEIGAYFAEIEP